MKVCDCCHRPLDKQFIKTGIFKTFKPLPEFPKMVQVARKLGYAIAIHGTQTRDIDIIAVPWIKNAKAPRTLIKAICGCGKFEGHFVVEKHNWKPTQKPHGRLAYVIYVAGKNTYIDLSIMKRG
jgi:hypothetical protein